MKHGNTGNKNASKGKDAFVHFKCTQEQKTAWVIAAKNEGIKFTDWCIRNNNASIK